MTQITGSDTTLAARPSYDLVVLGAGPAGLAAAWRAARRGFSVGLLERGDHAGGLASSFDVGGLRVDHGSHRLHPSTPPQILSDLHDLLGKDLQTRRRHGRLRVAERWVGFPLHAGDLLRELPRPLLTGIARDAAMSPFRRPRGDTYADVLRSGLGPTLYDALYAPYAEKLWGLPGHRISAEQARRRVAADTAWKVAGRTLRIQSDEDHGEVFFYPRRGFGQITDVLADAATEAGAVIHLQAEVARLRVVENEVSVTTQDGDVVIADRVFSTLPLPVLARVARPAPSLAGMESASRLRFRAMLLVYVLHEGGRWSPFDAHYVPGPETPVSRLSEPANYRSSIDDPDDRSVLCAEIPCAMTDDVWGFDDESLGDLVDEALAMTGLPPVQRAHVESRRLGHVYPVYKVGFEQDLAAVDSWARLLRRVVTFGRQGLFAHDNTHHSLQMAYDAVAALRDDRRFDRYAWTAARERYAAHVVED